MGKPYTRKVVLAGCLNGRDAFNAQSIRWSRDQGPPAHRRPRLGSTRFLKDLNFAGEAPGCICLTGILGQSLDGMSRSISVCQYCTVAIIIPDIIYNRCDVVAMDSPLHLVSHHPGPQKVLPHPEDNCSKLFISFASCSAMVQLCCEIGPSPSDPNSKTVTSIAFEAQTSS